VWSKVSNRLTRMCGGLAWNVERAGLENSRILTAASQDAIKDGSVHIHRPVQLKANVCCREREKL
jgi:hypothetical protein